MAPGFGGSGLIAQKNRTQIRHFAASRVWLIDQTLASSVIVSEKIIFTVDPGSRTGVTRIVAICSSKGMSSCFSRNAVFVAVRPRMSTLMPSRGIAITLLALVADGTPGSRSCGIKTYRPRIHANPICVRAFRVNSRLNSPASSPISALPLPDFSRPARIRART